MNFLRASALFLFLLAYAHCETTLAPVEVTDGLFRSDQERPPENLNAVGLAAEKEAGSRAGHEGAEPSHDSNVSEGNPNQFMPPNFVNMQPVQPAQPMVPPEQSFVPRVVPMNSMLNGGQANPALSPFQRQVPPFFGNPFRPSIIRSQGSNFLALPPKDQPAFDSFLCQQESTSKRDLEKRSLQPRHLEEFFMNTKNQDILFSVCGVLMPAHLVVIGSISKQFESKISGLKEKTNNEAIVINDIADLLDQSNADETEKNAAALPLAASNCSAEFAPAFHAFLKFFYFGGKAFDDINNLETGFLVWKLGAAFLDMETVQQQIEPRIASLISLDNLSKVYQFVKSNGVVSLNKRWSEFITSNSRSLAESGQLPLSCEQINGDIEYLDRFIEALNVNQSMAIGYIRQYLRTCPESSNFSPETGVNPFPRSLLFFRCTIEDLKELVKMGFISFEDLSREYENRLRVMERQCEEKCMAKFAPVTNPNYRHVITLNPGATLGGRRA